MDELARAVAAEMHRAADVTLDLDELSFLDARGLELLHDMAESGARLVGGSTFVSALIRQEGHHDDLT